MGKKSSFEVGMRIGISTVMGLVSPYHTYVDESGKVTQKQALWRVVCDCGRERLVGTSQMYKSRIPCTCSPRQGGNKTHGLAHTPEYKAWAKMNERVRNRNCKDYPDYGGRGISITPRWLAFENFYEDMGEKPSPKHSLDRIDVDGNYCPENCRWATPIEQANNKRSTIKVDVDGVQMTLRDLSEKIGVNPKTLRKRLQKGKDLDYVLSEDRHNYKRITIDGVTDTIAAHCRRYRVPYRLVMNDVHRIGKDPCHSILQRVARMSGTILPSNPMCEVRDGQTQTEAETAAT